MHRGDSRGGKHRRLELQGDLFRMLEFAEAAWAGGSCRLQKRRNPQQGSAGGLSRTPLVAGVEFNRCRTRFPLTDHHIVSLLDQFNSTRGLSPLLR